MNFIIAIIGINIFVYLLPYFVNFSNGFLSSNDAFLTMFYQQNDLIRSGEWYRLFTSLFLHGNLTHIALNMLTLWQLKDPMSVMATGLLGFPNSYSGLNGLTFIVVYLSSGLGGNLLSMQFSNNPSLGASGAILGLLGYLAGYAIASGNQMILSNLAINIVLLAVIGLLVPNIDNYAHFGGFITGLLLFTLLYNFKSFI